MEKNRTTALQEQTGEDNAITAQEPATVHGTNSYKDIMMMLYSMPITKEVKRHVGLRLVEETTKSHLAEAFDRIYHLSQLENDWDGHGALPISRVVLNNLRSVLLISDDEDWEDWMISPDVNATVCLYSPKTKASISLGATEYSYFARIDGKRHGESHVKYSPQSFLQLMRKYG